MNIHRNSFSPVLYQIYVKIKIESSREKSFSWYLTALINFDKIMLSQFLSVFLQNILQTNTFQNICMEIFIMHI